GGGGAVVTCEATERRVLGLLTFQTRSYGRVTGVSTGMPALGRWEHWLVLETESGPQRVLAGTEARTSSDADRLRQLIEGRAGEDSLVTSRSAAPVALAAAVFGCLWILIISLIMREFLGYHTPWWWRALGRRSQRAD
ncbi:MAG: hypothetical protein AAF725_18400, partial [Acidobacteriota bacterium]